jgi:hypothetical protein
MIPFQREWYLAKYPHVRQELAEGTWTSAEAHYHQKGCREGLSPSPYFNERWYRSAYPDVTRAIEKQHYRSGLHHYLLTGAREGRNPKPEFSDNAYLAAHPDVASAVARSDFSCGYEHYLSSGELEGRTTSLRDPIHHAGAPVLVPSVTDLPLLPPLHAELVRDKGAKPRLNVVLPSLKIAHMSGGPNTALNLVYRLAALGIPVRLMSCDDCVEPDEELVWHHITALTGLQGVKADIETADASNPARRAQIGENDVFFATAWWTAQRMTPLLPRMRLQKFLYMIQDFEPGLSAWSTEHSMALETYSMNMTPIFNSHVLRDYFVENHIGRFGDSVFAAEALAFEPAIDRSFFFPERRPAERPHRLLFYARPKSAHRNLFELGLSALHRAARAGLFSDEEWDLRFIGDPLPDTEIAKGVVIRSSPWLSYETYARLMRSSDVLLSLMLSPHPSYPPLEMAACGGVVVTNSYGSKTQQRLVRYGSNILAPEPSLQPLVDALGQAVHLVASGTREKPASTLPATWADAFEPVLPKLFSMCQQMLGHAR